MDKLRDFARWLHKVKRAGPEDCWEWQGSVSTNGYGRFRYGGKWGYAHRYSYEYFKGEIKDSEEVDHVCRHRNCVNPEHLRAIPRRSNRRRTSRRREVKFGDDQV